MSYQIFNEDLLDWAATYQGDPFHAMISDMPYHLTSIVDRFGAEGAAPAQHGTDGAYARASRGFMGKSWDGGDLAFRPDTWRALARHILPGGFIVAFASSRGYARMAYAMEQAGLIIHPSIFMKSSTAEGAPVLIEREIGLFGWAFGSGFPKAANVPEKIDKKRKHKGKVIAEKKHAPKFDAAGHGYREKDNGFNDKDKKTFPIREMSPEAALWAGMAYGAQAIKPAMEPIIVAQVPWGKGSQIDAILRTGAGAYNIDAARIETEDDTRRAVSGWQANGYVGGETIKNFNALEERESMGRWPAHYVLIHDHGCTPEACAPDCPIPALNQQAGASDDYGTDSYFYRGDWQAELAERLALADPVFYCPKVSPAERDAGLDGFGDNLISDGRAAPSDRPHQRNQTPRKNPHPTVKPIALTTWLAALLKPPAHIAGRVLIPCSGVGSEMIGALKAGWAEVVGVEIDPEYVPVAEARLSYWSQHDAPPAIPARRKSKAKEDASGRPQQIAMDL